jgi:hypothetical protein
VSAAPVAVGVAHCLSVRARRRGAAAAAGPEPDFAADPAEIPGAPSRTAAVVGQYWTRVGHTGRGGLAKDTVRWKPRMMVEPFCVRTYRRTACDLRRLAVRSPN